MVKIEEVKNVHGCISAVFVRDNNGDILRSYCHGSKPCVILDHRTGKYHIVEDTPLTELNGVSVMEYEKKIYGTVV
jgi:hypothetical protein